MTDAEKQAVADLALRALDTINEDYGEDATLVAASLVFEGVRDRVGAAVLELTAAGKPELVRQLLANFDEAERRVIQHGVTPGCPLCAEADRRLAPSPTERTGNDDL